LSVLPSHRKLTDERLRQAWARCPDDDTVLVPTGDAYSSDATDSSSPWAIAFRCPLHPDEIIRLWQPELQPLIDEVLAGVDVCALPIVGPGLLPQ
jgi:hypothetical protein